MKKFLLFILFFPLIPLIETIVRYPLIILSFEGRNYHTLLLDLFSAIIVAVIMIYINSKYRINASSKFLQIPAIVFILFSLLSLATPGMQTAYFLDYRVILEMVIYMLAVNNQFLKAKVARIV